MSSQSKISWLDGGATWPVVVGCNKCSPGCKHCYAVRQARRMAGNPNPKISSVYAGLTERKPDGTLDWTGQVRCVEERLDWPLRWKTPRRVFVSSLGDLFHQSVPTAFIDRVWNRMWNAYWHTFIVLTKRPERMRDYVVNRWFLANELVENVWVGVSVCNQRDADERIPLLRQTPAAVRFVSVEPMLEGTRLDLDGISWVICGGETGPGARPMHPDWVRSLRDQCKEASVPFYLKSWGEWLPSGQQDSAGYVAGGYAACGWPGWQVYWFHGEDYRTEYVATNRIISPDGVDMTFYRVGAKRAGHRLDRQACREYPAVRS